MSCNHRGTPVAVGPYTIYTGGRAYDQGMVGKYLQAMMLIVCLTERVPAGLEGDERVRHYPIVDMSGMPEGWANFLRTELIPALERGEKVMVFCFAGHGRTGTILAGLIALLEPNVADPITTLCERYCCYAVDTEQQMIDIFALRGQELPMKYENGGHNNQ